jgi:hypothetical protein
VRETAPARISTAQQPPAKFEKNYAKPTVTRIQEGMTEAGRVKTTKVKANSKANVLERINRFVFRRNPAEPEPDAAPAGGENPPVDGADAPVDSTDS